MKPKKHEFLTIPDAPNYEINGYFKARNKKTGKFLKRKKTGNGDFWINLNNGDRRIHLTCRSFYRKALAAVVDDDEYAPIPSLDNKYEINYEGEVRNTRTKRKIRLYCIKGSFCYHLKLNGKGCTKSRASLLNEVFDKNIHRIKKPVGAILRKDGLAYYFKSLCAASRFLHSKTGAKPVTARRLLVARRKDIYGWQVTYLG